MNTDRFTFLPAREGAPKALVANVECMLDGSYKGIKLRGVQIWRRNQLKEGEDGLFVAWPKRTYERPSKNPNAAGKLEEVSWDYVVSAEGDGNQNHASNTKNDILEAYRALSAKNGVSRDKRNSSPRRQKRNS